MLTDQDVTILLAAHWDLTDVAVAVHNGGLNSETWFVGRGADRWVAKAVPARRQGQLTAGLAVATHLQAAGIPAGAPVLTVAGNPVIVSAGRALTVLTWVPGAELTGGDAELLGHTLADVHRALAPVTVDGAERFHWVDPDAPHLDVRPWIRPAVTGALAALADLDPATLTWGLLHTDPAPEAFRRDLAGGACGLIDWAQGLEGPLLYDVASAVMYLGGPAPAAGFLRAYLDRGVLTEAEVDRGLLPMLRFRWAVQADYFAARVVRGDLTGLDSAAGNDEGLRDARRWLERLARLA